MKVPPFITGIELFLSRVGPRNSSFLKIFAKSILRGLSLREKNRSYTEIFYLVPFHSSDGIGSTLLALVC